MLLSRVAKVVIAASVMLFHQISTPGMKMTLGLCRFTSVKRLTMTCSMGYENQLAKFLPPDEYQFAYPSIA